MATTIKLKNGSGAPLAGDLVQGEPALDLTNKRLYTEDSGGAVIEIGTSPSTIDINAGTIDGTVIGGASAAAGTFTTVNASGTITGDVTGDLTGNVTGDVTGDLTGTIQTAAQPNITSVGTLTGFTSTGIDDNATSTAITIDASENVGIGTTSPQFQLHLSGSAPGVVMNETGAVKYYRNRAAASALTWDILNTDYSFNSEVMRIDSSGKVGIGTTSPAYQLSLSGDGTNMMQFDASTDAVAGSLIGRASSADLRIQQSEAANILFWTSNNERMRVTSGGYLLLGTTSTTVDTSNFGTRIGGPSSGSSLKSFRNAGAGSTCSAFGGNAGEARVMGDGDLQNTNNSYGAISDERFKSNIVDASSQIDDIMAVHVRSYTLNETGATHIGVVAQELEASGMSGLVKTDDEGMKSVKYSVLYMKAIKALQEAVTRIETLEAEVAALKGE